MHKLVRSAATNSGQSRLGSHARAIPDVLAPALLQLPKQVSAEPLWDAKQLASILILKSADAPQVTATLEMLGYAEPVQGKKDIWRNTQAGDTVAGAKAPRFNRESVLKSLEELRARAEQMNSDPASPLRATELIAFGDFLDNHSKVQAADVGVGLSPKHPEQVMPATAMETTPGADPQRPPGKVFTAKPASDRGLDAQAVAPRSAPPALKCPGGRVRDQLIIDASSEEISAGLTYSSRPSARRRIAPDPGPRFSSRDDHSMRRRQPTRSQRRALAVDRHLHLPFWTMIISS